ncbi:SH3 domain-containing protein [Streptomyces sp. NPDC051243]|uniref:SH3 domain-containing protein n=1 Tax=Streptomyces sp. NPDC051243 TaxID=3365646 RepID=UPI003795E1CA
MRVRHALMGSLAGAALVVGGLAAPAVQAADVGATAVTCGNAYWPHTNKDSGSGEVTKSGSAAVHTGPYGACTTVGYVSEGATVHYDCYSVNDYGNRWTWIRDANGSSLGWIYGKYLDDGGATTRC